MSDTQNVDIVKIALSALLPYTRVGVVSQQPTVIYGDNFTGPRVYVSENRT